MTLNELTPVSNYWRRKCKGRIYNQMTKPISSSFPIFLFPYLQERLKIPEAVVVAKKSSNCAFSIIPEYSSKISIKRVIERKPFFNTTSWWTSPLHIKP
jgi:hypothetical protein